MSDEKLETIKNNLWATTPKARLKARNDLKELLYGNDKNACDYMQDIHSQLKEGLVDEKWPFGWSTTINPSVMTLGGSSGGYSDKEPLDYRTYFPPPPAGEPHPQVTYRADDTSYWQPLITLSEQILAKEGIAEGKEDAQALFGNVNLDDDAERSNADIEIKPYLVKCLLKNIRDVFRPRVLVLVGIKGFIKHDRQGVAGFFEEIFPETKMKSLKLRHREDSSNFRSYPFEAYNDKQYKFAEWDVTGKDDKPIKIVLWPQSPEQSPMTNRELWQASCDEFLAKNPNLFA